MEKPTSRRITPADCVGRICEVMTRQNVLLFVGTIQEYRRRTEEICVELRRGESTPQGVLYHTGVKVRVYIGGKDDLVVLLYGAVSRNGLDKWWMEVYEVVAQQERRDSFRLPLRRDLTVQRGDEAPIPGVLVDVSLGGLCFQCRTPYQAGEQLSVAVRLRQDGPDYVFHCLIRRVGEPRVPGPKRFVYGCSFIDLPRHQTENLSQDIFLLQARAISRQLDRGE